MTNNIFDTPQLPKGKPSFDWAAATRKPTAFSLEEMTAVVRKVREDVRRCDDNIDRELASAAAQQALRSVLSDPDQFAEVAAGLRGLRFTMCPRCQWLYVRSHACTGLLTFSELFGFGRNVDVVDLFPGETRLDREHEARCLRSDRLGVPEREVQARPVAARWVVFPGPVLRIHGEWEVGEIEHWELCAMLDDAVAMGAVGTRKLAERYKAIETGKRAKAKTP